MSDKPIFPDVTVQLSGEDSNAVYIIGKVRRALNRAGADAQQIDEFTKEARSGDYDHVLDTCEEWVNVE